MPNDKQPVKRAYFSPTKPLVSLIPVQQEVKPMSHAEIVKALVSYRVLEEQKAAIVAQQDALKATIEAHMVATKVEKMEENDVVAQFVPRTRYTYDIPQILQAVPTAISKLKISNEDYLKVLKGNEALIGEARKVLSDEKSLTIRAKKTASED